MQQCLTDIRDNWQETPVTLTSIKRDLTAGYYLLGDLKWDDTFYQHISYRHNHNNSNTIIIPTLKPNNSSLSFEYIELNSLHELYHNVYLHRDDINVILHVHNPCISAISLDNNGFIPVDQQYYVFYPIAYNIEDIINKKLYTKHNYPSYVLLLNDADGILVFGNTMHDTFTRLFNIMSGAQGQCIALSIMNKNEIILPPKKIQIETVYDRYQVGPIHNYMNGIPEFNSLKRKYGYMDVGSICYPNNYNIHNNDTETNIRLRQDLAKLYHILDSFSWTDLIFQHITARIERNDKTDRILINPFGLEFGEIEYDKFVELLVSVDKETKESKYEVINAGNSQFAGNIQKSCLELHSAIYSYRDDIDVVIHIHHPVLSAIGVYKHGVLPLNKLYYNIIKPIRYHSFGSLGHNQNKSAMITDFGYDSNVLILRNHGIITTGKNISDAFNKLYYTIQLAELQVNVMKMALLNNEILSDLINYIIQDDDDNVAISHHSHLNVWKRFH